MDRASAQRHLCSKHAGADCGCQLAEGLGEKDEELLGAFARMGVKIGELQHTKKRRLFDPDQNANFIGPLFVRLSQDNRFLLIDWQYMARKKLPSCRSVGDSLGPPQLVGRVSKWELPGIHVDRVLPGGRARESKRRQKQ